MKTKNAKKVNGKADKKTAKCDKKCGKKCGIAIAMLALAAVVCGCASTGAQPSRSQTQNNDLRNCIVVIAASATVSNTTVVASSEDGFLPSEIFTQTMKNEGNEQNTPTATPTNTTRIDPKTDVNTTGGRSAGVLESIVGAFGTWLATPSGKSAVSGCADGSCSDSDCPDGICSEPSSCRDCEVGR